MTSNELDETEQPRPAPARGAPTASRRHAVLLALVMAAAMAPHLETIGHGFVFDDEIVIVKNRFLGSLDGLRQLLTRTEWAGGGIEVAAWRPLTGLTYAANRALFGPAAWSFHAANVLLHGVAAALLFVVALRLGLRARAAAVAALLFGLHPIHVEAVANVVGRKELLATILLLAMLLAHRAFVARGGWGAGAAVAAYLGAMFSKEVGAVGIALVLLGDWLLPPTHAAGDAGRRRRALLVYGAYAVALLAYVALLRQVTGGLGFGAIPFQDNPAAYEAWPARVMTAIAVVGKGLLLQALPVSQSPDWSFDAIPVVRTATDVRFVASAAFLAIWGALGSRARRSAPFVLLAGGWYLIALLPASNLLFPVGTLFGERLLYLPSVGLALLAGKAFDAFDGKERGRVAVAASAVLGLLLASGTARYAHAWGDDLRLFEWAGEHASGSTKVHANLAALLLKRGRLDEALAEARRSLRILPSSARAELVQADVLGRLGRPDEQGQALRRAYAEAPDDPEVLRALGGFDRDAGRLEEAAGLWRRLVARRPMDADALSDLAAYHLVKGDPRAALTYARRAVEADPARASGWYNLGLAWQSAGDARSARAAFLRFLEVAGTEYEREAAAVRAMLAR